VRGKGRDTAVNHLHRLCVVHVCAERERESARAIESFLCVQCSITLAAPGRPYLSHYRSRIWDTTVMQVSEISLLSLSHTVTLGIRDLADLIAAKFERESVTQTETETETETETDREHLAGLIAAEFEMHFLHARVMGIWTSRHYYRLLRRPSVCVCVCVCVCARVCVCACVQRGGREGGKKRGMCRGKDKASDRGGKAGAGKRLCVHAYTAGTSMGLHVA